MNQRVVPRSYRKLLIYTLVAVAIIVLEQLMLNHTWLDSVILAGWMSFPLCIVTALLLYFSDNQYSPRGVHYGLLAFWLICQCVAFYCVWSIYAFPQSAVKMSHAAPLMMFTIGVPVSSVTILTYYLFNKG
ncbi:hypothetical protein [Thaumasiovibrio sp. DFM-14]|uniref:hypothetical protein n=1 Tax=Thaumasiovibrio sp. DFM-14 TaxID=3384792 RepID=UPI00399F985C